MIVWGIKIAGAGLILAGSFLFGTKYRTYLQRRWAILDSIYKTLCMIREKIIHENELLVTGMVTCGKAYPVPEGNLFERFANSMEGMDIPGEQWKKHVNDYLHQYGIYTEPLASGLHAFSDAWQHVSPESVTSSIESACGILETEIKEAEVKQQKEGALALKISLAIGILLIVLLI